MMKDGQLVPTDVSGKVIRRLEELGVDALVAIGGDGSIKLSAKLLEAGAAAGDRGAQDHRQQSLGTDQTFGFDTAVATATEAMGGWRPTAQAHERVMVVEVEMGRHAGWIALYSGIAGGADVV